MKKTMESFQDRREIDPAKRWNLDGSEAPGTCVQNFTLLVLKDSVVY